MAGKTKFELQVISNVKEMRLAKGLSQYDIAVILGTSSSFVGQVEVPNHSSKYNLNHLNKLANAMQCSPQDFIPKKVVPEADWE